MTTKPQANKITDELHTEIDTILDEHCVPIIENGLYTGNI